MIGLHRSFIQTRNKVTKNKDKSNHQAVLLIYHFDSFDEIMGQNSMLLLMSNNNCINQYHCISFSNKKYDQNYLDDSINYMTLNYYVQSHPFIRNAEDFISILYQT